MSQRAKIRSIFDRIVILKSNPVIENNVMQTAHLSMLEEGFYQKLNEIIDQICLQIRTEIDLNSSDTLCKAIADRDVKLAYYQKLLSTTLNNRAFIKSIVYSQSFDENIWYPLKKNWLNQLSVLGLRFNQPICSILMFIHELKTSLRSILGVFKYVKHARLAWDSRQNAYSYRANNSEVFLYGFAKENFPTASLPSHNFFEWLENYLGTDVVFYHDQKEICDALPSHKNLIYQNSIRDRLYPQSFFHVLFDFLKLFLRVVVSKKFKSIHYLYITDEVMISQQIMEGAIDLSLDYVFIPSSYLVIKPLWATTLESLGVKVVSVHYSASAEPRDSKHKRVVSGIWHLSNWVNSWVIDQEQINQMTSTSEFSSRNYKIIGVPYWAGKIFVPSRGLKEPFLSVFDTYINDPSFLSSGTIDSLGWNDYKLEFTFVEIILECASELGLTVLHKKKRKISKFSTLPEIRFAEFRAKLVSKYGALYQQLDEDYSAHSLIEISRAVVSKPFSTPAYLAKQIGVPSFFLDPTGNIGSEDPGLRECSLVKGKTDLKALLENVLI
jgi:polysaccharide biosynthesis PFTS motif protein